MEDLHAAIAAHLRRHNSRYLKPCPPPVPLLDVPRCRRCRAAITAEGDQFEIAVLLADGRCVDCHMAEAV